MKITLILLLFSACIGLVVFGSQPAPVDVATVVQEKESKTQPKDVVLSKDSQSDKYGEVPFSHENHATKKYSPDGQAMLTCVESVSYTHLTLPTSDLV